MNSTVPVWFVEFSAAVSLSLAQLLMTLAVICFVLASYALWGSPSTPLIVCWKIAVVALILEFLFNQLHNYCLRELIRRDPKMKQEIATWSTKTRINIPKLTKSDFEQNEKEPK